MSALAFSVHVDKENATPCALGAKNAQVNVKTFGIQKKKLIGSTPRKALFDVNNERQLSSNIRSKNNTFLEPTKKPAKHGLQISNGIENRNVFKKGPLKIKEPESVQKKKVPLKSTVKAAPPLPEFDPTKIVDDEGDYSDDSDSIWPRHERLSTYVGKLFSWRPPCLWGELPDSEPEDQPEPELDDIIIPPPPQVFELDFPDSDMLDLSPVPLPDLDLEGPDRAAASTAGLLSLETSLTLEPTPDTSLALGPLQVMSEATLSGVSEVERPPVTD